MFRSFGSSGITANGSFPPHPSVMAARYHNYTPSSSVHGVLNLFRSSFGILIQWKTQMRDNKAVYIISPQWFYQAGCSTTSFQVLQW